MTAISTWRSGKGLYQPAIFSALDFLVNKFFGKQNMLDIIIRQSRRYDSFFYSVDLNCQVGNKILYNNVNYLRRATGHGK